MKSLIDETFPEEVASNITRLATPIWDDVIQMMKLGKVNQINALIFRACQYDAREVLTLRGTWFKSLWVRNVFDITDDMTQWEHVKLLDFCESQF